MKISPYFFTFLYVLERKGVINVLVSAEVHAFEGDVRNINFGTILVALVTSIYDVWNSQTCL